MRPIRNNPLFHSLILWTFLGVALYLAWLAYAPGLSGTFVFDDGPNIEQNSSLQIQHVDADTIRRAAFSSDSGVLKRPISMLSFAVNATLTGLNPYYFKMTNLVIHMINGISIYFLTLLLLQSLQARKNDSPSDSLSYFQCQIVALATAGAWMLHPLNLTSVLYIVQRMTSLSATFTIWGLLAFTWGRLQLYRGHNGRGWILASLLLFTPLALLCKENGALLPVYMLVIELTLFRFQATPSGKRFLAAIFGLSVLLPALCFAGFLAVNPSWLVHSYVGRAFTLDERLMTEARVVWFYLHEIVSPNPIQMGLFHDDIARSRSLLSPISTLWSIIGLLLLLALSWLARKKAPLLSFGILFFFAGHLIESTIFPLELVHEHRNYLPMYGILLAAFYYLLYPLRYADTLAIRRVAGALMIGLLAYSTWSRATHWATPFELAQYEVTNHPNSPRDNGEMGNKYVSVNVADAGLREEYYQKARQYYEHSAEVDPDYTVGLFALILVNSSTNREVDSKWIAELKHRLEFSALEANTGNTLSQLVQCKVDRKCVVESRTLLDLINAALRNPSIDESRRALILSSLSLYLTDVAQDYPQALNAMRQMVQLQPKIIEYRLNLVQYLIAMQKPQEAKQQLDEIRQRDRLRAYTAQIAQIEQQLQQK